MRPSRAAGRAPARCRFRAQIAIERRGEPSSRLPEIVVVPATTSWLRAIAAMVEGKSNPRSADRAQSVAHTAMWLCALGRGCLLNWNTRTTRLCLKRAIEAIARRPLRRCWPGGRWTRYTIGASSLSERHQPSGVSKKFYGVTYQQAHGAFQAFCEERCRLMSATLPEREAGLPIGNRLSLIFERPLPCSVELEENPATAAHGWQPDPDR